VKAAGLGPAAMEAWSWAGDTAAAHAGEQLAWSWYHWLKWQEHSGKIQAESEDVFAIWNYVEG